MPRTVDESTPSKGDALSVPVGTDPRTAESLDAAWQALANRLKFLENFFDAFFSTLAFVSDATWTVANTKVLQIKAASGTATLDLSQINTLFNGLVAGPLFQTGATGRAPKKPQLAAPLTANATVDLRVVDTVIMNPASGAITLDIENHPYEHGAHLRVVNQATALGYTIAIRNPAGGTIYTLDPGSSVDHPCYVDIVLGGAASTTWIITGQNKVV